MAENEEAIEGFDRAVRRSERELAAVVARVKDEEVGEVVELDAEMEEGIVKEEEEAKLVVAAPAGGGGGVSQWLRGLMGLRDAGAIQDLPWDPAVLVDPTPQTCTPPSSSPRRVRYRLSGFCWCGCTTSYWGRGGGCGWTRGGLSTWTSPCA